MSVKRYQMQESAYGPFVQYKDFFELQAKYSALREAARPVVEWWEFENPIGIYNPSDKILQVSIECGSKTKYAIVTAEQLDALAALVGEE